MNRKGESESVELLRGVGVVFSAHLVGRALSFVYHLLLARLLGPLAYGVFLLSQAIFTFAAQLADLGLRWGVLRELAAAQGRGESTVVKGTILGGAVLALGGSLLGAVGLLAAKDWASSLFKAPDLHWLLPLFAVSLPFAAVGTIFVSSLQALRRVGALSAIQYLLDPSLRIGTFVGVIFLGGGLLAAAASHLLASIAIAVVALFSLSSAVPLFSRVLPAHFCARPVLVFSLPLLFSNVVGSLLHWADTLLVGYYLAAGEVGVYGAAGRLASLGAMVLTAVSTVFAPTIHALYGRRDLDGVRRLYQRSTHWVLVIVVPLFLCTALNAEALLALFGREFATGAPALLALAAASLIMTGTGPAGDVLLMAGRSRAVLYASALCGALGLVLNAWMIPRWGLLGAALATGLALAMGNIANIILAWRFTGLQPYTSANVKPVLLALGVTGLQVALAPLTGESLLARLGAAGGIWLLYPLLVRRLALAAEDLEVWNSFKGSLRCAASPGS